MTGAFCLPNQSTGGEDLDDIPIEHLDYSYIKGCKDVPYLAKILDRLRSGKVGLYPHLIEFCEKHVEKLDPRCRALRKDNPVATSASVSSEEWSQIIDDMEKWQKESRIAETSLKPLEGLEKDDLPPVRGDNCCVPVSKNSKAQQKKIVSKPRDYSEWDKFDVEKECQKIDGDDVEKETPSINNSVHPKIRTALETSARTAQEKLILANHEKDKGNEAFRANDYEEAVAYYSRSISIIPTVAAFNNRAQANIKTKNWHRAMTDCQKVLEMDPGNTKGLLRRASVYKHKGDLERAAEDLRKVLEEEPNNTPASQLLSEITKQMEEPGHEKKGKRILIEEVDDEENGDEVSATARPVEPSQQQQPVGGEESSSDMGNAQRKPHGRGDGGPHCEPGNSHHHGPSRGKADKYRVPSAAADGVTNGTGKRGSTAAAAADPKSPGEQTRRKSADLDAPCGALPPPLSRLKNEGNLLFKNGQFADALGKYSLAIQGYTDSGLDSPDDLCILYSNRAACYLKDGNSQECIQDCTRSLELQPFSLKPLLRRAMAYESLERYRKAYVDYKTVLQVDRSVQAAHDSVNRITKMLIEQDGPDWREKLPEIPLVPLSAQQHPREEPVSAEVLQARAEKAAKDAERRRESRFAAFKQDGNEFVKKGQFQEALAKYTECLKLKPEECAIYTNRALCYLKQDRFAEAKDDCDAALRLEPANKKAFYRRAMANKGLKDYQACRADLEEVLQLDPGVQEARTELEEVTTLIQQDKPSPGKSRKVVPITEVDSSREASPPPDSRTDDVSINLHPSNAYEFGQALNAAHSGGNMAACAQILSNTAPEKLPQLLSKHLDASILLFIMQALDSHLMDQNPDLVYRHLNHLHTAGRFSVVLVLLEKDKHAQMAQMFDRLSAVKSTEFTRNDVQNLAAKYQVQA